MEERAKPVIRIDLAQFKLHIHLKPKTDLTLHFDSPSRRFYLAIIALVVHEMKRLGQVTSIPLEAHADQLTLVNETVGESLGSSEKENLIPRIYRKWKDALPDLENAPLFKVIGHRKEQDEGPGKTYRFTEAEKDAWANLFEYKGSHEHVRLRFSIDTLGATLDDTVILYEDAQDHDAWERFIANLEQKPEARAQAAPAVTIPQEPVAPIPEGQGEIVKSLRRRNVLLIASLAAVLGIVAFALWHAYAPARRGNLASIEKMAFPLPDKPSIAVLPLVNLSKDPEQEYLADGLAEAIIDGLSKCPQIVVIARNSSFTYGGKPVKVQQVAEDLGVRYVLEGSVQKSADRVRIAVQLIDALTGQHLLSERYDRELKDLLVMQDEITMKILAAVQVKLTAGEDARLRTKETMNLEAYLKLIEAGTSIQTLNRETLALARQLMEQALALDSGYAAAYAMLGAIQVMEVMVGVYKNPREALEQATKLAEKAIALESSNVRAHVTLAAACLYLRHHDKAIAEAEKAVSLAPNSARAYSMLGSVLTFAGRPQEAIPFYKKSLRLSPIPVDPTTLVTLGMAYRHAGQYEEALASSKRALQLYGPDHLLAHVGQAATYVMMGREKEAHAEAAEVLRIDPTYSVEAAVRRFPFKNQKDIDNGVSVLRKAGLK